MKWFDITDPAKAQMEKLLAKHPDKYAVSLAVLGGGCAGFKYDWGFVDKKEDIGKDDGGDAAATVHVQRDGGRGRVARKPGAMN